MTEIPTLDFGLGETADILRETVRAFASREIAPLAAEIDRACDLCVFRLLAIAVPAGRRGSGTALYLAERGHRVTVLTPALHVGHHLGHTAALGLLAKALTEREVRVITSAALGAIEREQVVILDLLSGRERREPFDAVVLATLPEANDEIVAELDGRGVAATAIGDCVAPRKATMALYEARRLALEL